MNIVVANSSHNVSSTQIPLLGLLRLDQGLLEHSATTLVLSYKGYDRITDVTTLASRSVLTLPTTVSGDFSVVATFLSRPETGAVGLYITNGTAGVLYAIGDTAAITTAYAIVPDIPELNSLPIALMIQYVSGVASYYYSLTTFPEVWVPYATPSVVDPETGETTPGPPPPTVTGVTQTGLLLDPAGSSGTAEIALYRVFSGTWTGEITETEDLKQLSPPPVIPVDPLTPSEEAIIHGLVAAQFGDLDYDTGKSVGWMQYFTDDLFVSDINMGDQRYWVVNWTKSFPEINYIFTGLNYFTDTENFRRQQFLDAQTLSRERPDLLTYDDNDWVMFIDAHEGLSADNRSLPDDYHVEPFKSFVFREIARANTAGFDRIVLPFFVFLRHDHIQNVEYDVPTLLVDDTPGPPIVAQQPCGVPYYLAYQGLTRMLKVSVLRDPSFDWSILDTPVALPAAAGYLTSTVGSVSTPDLGPLPSDCVVVWKLRPSNIMDTDQSLGGQWDAGQVSWSLYLQNGNFFVALSLDGTTTITNSFAGAVNATTVPNGVDVFFAMRIQADFDGTKGRVTVLRSTDGVNWTQVGFVAPNKWTVLHDSTGPIRAGTRRIGFGPWEGRMYSMELRTGIDPNAGTVLWRFDGTDYPGTGTSYTDPRGKVWTLTNASAITPYQPPGNVKIQIISYGYAHWNDQNIEPPATTVPPLTAQNDEGWKQRCLLSQVLPIPGLPVGSASDPVGTWVAPASDPAGLRGPWAPDTHASKLQNVVIPNPPPAIATVVAGVRVPLYDLTFRLNLRDGVWYEGDTLGNIPLHWNDETGEWEPAVPPEQWV